MSVRIVCTDTDTGESETQEITDDYCVITAGSRYVSGIVTYPKTGTAVITVRRDAAASSGTEET
jgi:hypothetical protein